MRVTETQYWTVKLMLVGAIFISLAQLTIVVWYANTDGECEWDDGDNDGVEEDVLECISVCLQSISRIGNTYCKYCKRDSGNN